MMHQNNYYFDTILTQLIQNRVSAKLRGKFEQEKPRLLDITIPLIHLGPNKRDQLLVLYFCSVQNQGPE